MIARALAARSQYAPVCRGHSLSRSFTTSTLTSATTGGSGSGSRSYSSSTSGTTSEYDVLVIGGGLVGTAMACALQRSTFTRELKVGLVDAQLDSSKRAKRESRYAPYRRAAATAALGMDQTAARTTDDEELTPSRPGIRVSALSRASQRLLERLGVWQKLDPEVHPITAYDKMQVWDEVGGGILRFDARDHGLANLGHIVDNELLVGALLERLQESSARTQAVDIIPDSVRNVILTDSIGASRDTLQWSNKLNIHEMADSNSRSSSSSSRGGGSGGENITAGTGDFAHVELASGANLRASLIIAADGANSPIRNRFNIPTSQFLFNHRAFVCSVETEKPHTIAFQRFLRTGPIAMLPVGQGGRYSNIVWSTTPEHARWLEQLSPSELIEAINVAFHDSTETTDDNYSNIVDRFVRAVETRTQIPKQRGAFFSTDIPPRPPRVVALVDQQGYTPNKGSFPLRRQHAHEYVKPKLALIGDAAHTCHPLAGQGVNMGIADVARMTHTLQYAIQSGTQLGNAVLLRQEYEKPQFRRNERMLQGFDVIKKLFETNHDTVPGFPFVRALGMLGLDNLPFAKGWFVDMAIGSDIDVEHVGFPHPHQDSELSESANQDKE